MSYIGKTPTIGNFQVCDAISVVNGQAAYTMQVNSVNVVPESANHMLVSLNGILQKPGSSFTVSGSTITFASNLSTGDVIDFITILGNVLDLGVPSDDTVTASKLNDDIISGQTELASEPADTDEFLVSDAGTIKRIDYSLIKGSGKVLQVVSNTTSGTCSTTSDTFTDATNCPSLNITPSATSSKIFLIASIGSIENGGGTGVFSIFRDSTNLGDSSNGFGYLQPDGTTYLGGGANFLDSPSSTSSINYEIRIRNTTSGQATEISRGSTNATLTAFEIGA